MNTISDSGYCYTCHNYVDTPMHEYGCAYNGTITTKTVDIPSAYPHHQHASEEARTIAKDGLILLTLVGSGAHGTAQEGQDDRDEMGICLEPREYVTGLSRVPAGERRTIPFEQFERHTAWDRPGGVKNRSGAGDLDTIIYSARKWARLAMDGNPTVLLPLFTPKQFVVYRSKSGYELTQNANKFISQRVADRYLGYLHAQRGGMTGIGHTNRPELVSQFGYDTKFAMHALRLGFQGIEILTTGKVTLPTKGTTLEVLQSVRRGEWGLTAVMDLIQGLENDLRTLSKSNDLPPEPDIKWINDWLHHSYTNYWKQRESNV